MYLLFSHSFLKESQEIGSLVLPVHNWKIQSEHNMQCGIPTFRIQQRKLGIHAQRKGVRGCECSLYGDSRALGQLWQGHSTYQLIIMGFYSKLIVPQRNILHIAWLFLEFVTSRHPSLQYPTAKGGIMMPSIAFLSLAFHNVFDALELYNPGHW